MTSVLHILSSLSNVYRSQKFSAWSLTDSGNWSAFRSLCLLAENLTAFPWELISSLLGHVGSQIGLHLMVFDLLLAFLLPCYFAATPLLAIQQPSRTTMLYVRPYLMASTVIWWILWAEMTNRLDLRLTALPGSCSLGVLAYPICAAA